MGGWAGGWANAPRYQGADHLTDAAHPLPVPLRHAAPALQGPTKLHVHPIFEISPLVRRRGAMGAPMRGGGRPCGGAAVVRAALCPPALCPPPASNLWPPPARLGYRRSPASLSGWCLKGSALTCRAGSTTWMPQVGGWLGLSVPVAPQVAWPGQGWLPGATAAAPPACGAPSSPPAPLRRRRACARSGLQAGGARVHRVSEQVWLDARAGAQGRRRRRGRGGRHAPALGLLQGLADGGPARLKTACLEGVGQAPVCCVLSHRWGGTPPPRLMCCRRPSPSPLERRSTCCCHAAPAREGFRALWVRAARPRVRMGSVLAVAAVAALRSTTVTAHCPRGSPAAHTACLQTCPTLWPLWPSPLPSLTLMCGPSREARPRGPACSRAATSARARTTALP